MTCYSRSIAFSGAHAGVHLESLTAAAICWRDRASAAARVLLLGALAVALMAGEASANPFADNVVYHWDGQTATYTPGGSDNMTFGPFHSSNLWSDPSALLGKPNVVDKDDTDWNPSTSEFREINVVWPAWYQGAADPAAANTNYASNPTGSPKINNGVGLKQGSQIVVEFDDAVTDDPANPYGVDLIVHGNPFFATGSMVHKDTNMNEYVIEAFGGGGAGAVFEERVTVSVAQSLDGPWYEFETAFGDWFFPTQPVAWDREKTNPNRGDAGDWTDQENDWTKPVNPALADLASEAAEAGTGTWGYFGNRSVADALDLYSGSAGGTGFDLAESGFEWIKYVKLTDPENKQGEICGIVDAAPASAGDRLIMSWHNVHETGQNRLDFQDADDPSVNLAFVEIAEIDQVSYVSVDVLDDLSGLTPITGPDLGAYLVEIDEVFPDEGTVSFEASLGLRVDDAYQGDGSDLLLLHWNGLDWDDLVPSGYDAESRLLTVEGLHGFSAFVVTQAPVPEPSAMALAGIASVALLGLACRRGQQKRFKG